MVRVALENSAVLRFKEDAYAPLRKGFRLLAEHNLVIRAKEETLPRLRGVLIAAALEASISFCKNNSSFCSSQYFFDSDDRIPAEDALYY